jgi:predicted PurR-regulated permease PerM
MSDAQRWQLLLIGVAGAGLLYLLAPVLTPFLIAALLAYLGNPLAERLQDWGLPRGAAVGVVFAALAAGLLGLALLIVPRIEQQLQVLVLRLPDYLAWAQQHALPWLSERVGAPALDAEALRAALVEHWQAAGGAAAGLLDAVTRSGTTFIAWVANAVLVPVVAFYLLRDWHRLVEHAHGLLPRPLEPTVTRLARESDQVLGAFLHGQLLVMLALAAIYTTGLWLVGLDLALLIGGLAGLLSFVPYLGLALGVLAAGAAAAIQFQEATPVLLVLLVFGVGQVIETVVLAPRLIGERIGLHPVAVIFAVLAGGHLFGFFGVLLALPAAAVVVVLLRHAHERYLGSPLYEGAGRTPGPS